MSNTRRATQPAKEPSALEVPAEIMDALIGYGLRTDVGQALFNGWRSAHPAVHPSKGNALVTVGPGRVVLAPKAPKGTAGT